MSSSSSISRQIALEREENEQMLLTFELTGEYRYSEREERPSFYHRDSMEWFIYICIMKSYTLKNWHMSFQLL